MQIEMQRHYIIDNIRYTREDTYTQTKQEKLSIIAYLIHNINIVYLKK